MFKYLNLDALRLEILTDKTMITKGVIVSIDENSSIAALAAIMKAAAQKLVEDLDDDKVYNFIISLNGGVRSLTEEEFESAVNCALTYFFDALVGRLGRARERRLDVPEHLKRNINCNMSLLKRAINYRTLVDKFQLEIRGGDFIYVLVGGLNE